jgi:hypothetical protein
MMVTAAAQAAPSGDTCTYAVGTSGTNTTVTIVTGGAQQYGFAFDAPGTAIKNVSISGRNGNFTTSNLPRGSNGAWTSDDQATGTLSATLILSGKATGAIVVRPSQTRASATPTAAGTYYDAVKCTLAKAAPTAFAFSVNPRATYVKSVSGWHLLVTVPTAATVSAKQAILQSPGQRVQSLVQAKRLGIKSRGVVTLTLKPTPKGLAMLTSQKVIKVKMMVTVDAADGRQSHKTVSLALRK